MVSIFRRFWSYLYAPQLYKLYNTHLTQVFYEANALERWGDSVIHTLNLAWNIGVYTSPVLAIFLHRRGYVALESFVVLTKIIVGIGIILSTSYCLRGIGRLNNPVYVQFYEALVLAKKDLNKNSKKTLMQYDFDFKYWPVEYKWNDTQVDERQGKFSVRSPARVSFFNSALSFPCHIISNIIAHTVAIKLIYPGSIRTLQYFMSPMLLQGRTKLIEDHKAERFKLCTYDSNDIDIIFIDRRNEPSAKANGSTLVICCEGNAAFYEVGIIFTPIEGNYSVLGWNHPGFGGSTGQPYPEQERNAIDVVMQFAINQLGFPVDKILLYGWSIGGYTSSYAAMSYPDVAGLILDATFDDILPLAIPRMPESLSPLVRRVIREHFNLNVAEQVSRYRGPVLFIRRTEDEIICTDEGVLGTNRGNYLAAKVLKRRYPVLLDEPRQELLKTWLGADHLQQALIMDQHHIDKEFCQSLLASYIEDNSLSYPMEIGEGLTDAQKSNLTLFLAEKYMKSYKSSHCTPLPVNLFRKPWVPTTSDSGFVKL